jgi:hypothetical protein
MEIILTRNIEITLTRNIARVEVIWVDETKKLIKIFVIEKSNNE